MTDQYSFVQMGVTAIGLLLILLLSIKVLLNASPKGPNSWTKLLTISVVLLFLTYVMCWAVVLA